MAHFNRVTIIGVGLIGGSIGLAVKKRRLAREVVGVFRRSATLRKALKQKAIDKGYMSVAEGVKGADLVILASPVSSIIDNAIEAGRYASKGALFTDVGSTKGLIVDRVEKFLSSSGIDFVGSHPMAGSEHAGVEYARNDLLEGAPCIVMQTKNTKRAALRKVIDIWRALGLDVKIMTPSEHDRRVAFISHLPHVVAFSLAGAVPEKDIVYAAEGFRDTTRVASSDPDLWADIFLTNKDDILSACSCFDSFYKDIRTALSKDDRAGLVKALKKAKSKRDKFIDGRKR